MRDRPKLHNNYEVFCNYPIIMLYREDPIKMSENTKTYTEVRNVVIIVIEVMKTCLLYTAAVGAPRRRITMFYSG